LPNETRETDHLGSETFLNHGVHPFHNRRIRLSANLERGHRAMLHNFSDVGIGKSPVF
jgi:hypothetical protein